MSLGNFKEYLDKKIVRAISSNKLRSLDLISSSDKRNNFLNEIIKNIKISEDNASYFIEQVYDILIELIRAKMFMDGFSASGNYAHEAEVSYLKELKFNYFEVNTMNEIRQFRNGIKYYGKKHTSEGAQNSIKFMNSFIPKLKKILNTT